VKAIDFFCGAGGLTKGLSLAGINVLGGIDIEPSFKKTYENNNPESIFNCINIKNLTTRQLGKLFNDLQPDDPDLLFTGCAPCQSFSSHRKATSKRPDEDVLLDFGRLVNDYLPGQVMIENVRGIVKQDVFINFINLLRAHNYNIWYEILNAQDFGVPQNRKRLVVIAMRGKKVAKPKPTHGEIGSPYLTVRMAISHLPPLEVGSDHDIFPNHVASNLSELNFLRIKNTPKNGGSWSSWPDDLKLSCHKKLNGYTDFYGRMSWDKPAPTITCKCNSLSNGRFGHPEQDRAISLREAAALQSFPDDYIFFGNQGSIAKQIGNAVPVQMAKALGEHILKLRGNIN